MPRALLLMPSTTYKASAFLEAARKVRVEVVVGTDQRQALDSDASGRTITLDFSTPEAACRSIVAFARDVPVDLIVPTDDETTVVAALASEALSLDTNPPGSARAALDKLLMRRCLAAAGVPSPAFRSLPVDRDPRDVACDVSYPCVVKPRSLSASRGVIRADDPPAFVEAFERVAALLRSPEVEARMEGTSRSILVEEFVPGSEVALEGLLTDGGLRTLALFDKPDPLDGPYFEETLYVTPSRLPGGVRGGIERCAAQAARALGLRSGPVHAELRVNARGPWLIEMAARTIGGLCSRALRFGTGLSLEELILLDATGADTSHLEREEGAAGVMMIPIRRRGILEEVTGRDEAGAVEGVEEIVISCPTGQMLVPLPEGNRYLGFIFARAETPGRVEASLRRAHALLGFRIA